MEAVTSDVIELYEEAVQLQLSGAIEDAVSLYLEILNVEPRHPDANHNLGVIEAHTISAEAALPRFEAAVMANPASEQYWVSYIDALAISGAIETAASAIVLGAKHGLSNVTAKQLHEELADRLNEALSTRTAQQVYQDVVDLNIAEIKQSLNPSGDGKLLENRSIQPDLDLTAFKSKIEPLFEANKINEILTFIFNTTDAIKFLPELVGHKIFTPYFDQVLERVDLSIQNVKSRTNKVANLVIASEIYNFGGHTKIIAELISTLENPILVLTDVFNRFNQTDLFEKIAPTFLPNCPVFVLPKNSYLDKSKRLSEFINVYAKNVYLLSHHEDVVAIAACQKNLEATYYFVHHADHNPALGNHVKHFNHVDVFEDRTRLCSHDLHTHAICLPSTANDQGAKDFHYPIQAISTVTAGTANKFLITGELSLDKIVVESIRQCGGQHYHFGELSDQFLEVIRTALLDASINPDCFIYMGNVASLWQSLLQIDGHIYVGSAPVMGGKGDIEAQGAAYPLLAYKDFSGPRYLNVGSHNPKTTYWSTLAEFRDGLTRIISNHSLYSQASRAFYLSNCSRSQFEETVFSLSQ